jgi:hypothetical protein
MQRTLNSVCIITLSGASAVRRPANVPRIREFWKTERIQPMPAAQNFKNHVRWDPAWHYFMVPMLMLNIVFAAYKLVHDWHLPANHHFLFGWWVVMSIVFFMAFMKARMYPLKAQDRIIRLEERLRMQALLNAEELVASQALTEEQLIGLRFASDAELPALVARAVKEKLTQGQIKQAIVTWRPDYFRV